MEWLLIIGFAVSASIDNFGVGLSYGVQRVQIPAASNALIAAVALVFSLAGIFAGAWLAGLLPAGLLDFLAFGVLSAIGLRIMYTARRGQKKQNSSVFAEPEKMDFDGSAHISLGEALVLGIALSANALTNGVGAGLLALPPLAIAITAAIGSYVTLLAGVKAGIRLADVQIGKMTVGQFGAFLSGLIILLIAVTRLF